MHMRVKIVLRLIILINLAIRINSGFTPITNCFFSQYNKLFVLLDLRSNQPYSVSISQNQKVVFNFCQPFYLQSCKFPQKYLGYFIDQQNGCFPLTSSSTGKFSFEYSLVQSFTDQNILSMVYQKDDGIALRLGINIICSEQQFDVIDAKIMEDIVWVGSRSIYGCPIYHQPPLLELIQSYRILIAIFAFIIGFLFLFYGRVMIKITTFFSITIALQISLSYLCFWFMQQSVGQIYLYFTLIVIFVSSILISYFMVRFCIKMSLFFLGALFAFFTLSFFKPFVLSIFSQKFSYLFLANGIYNFFTVMTMFILGSLTLQHKDYIIIYTTACSGSYLIVRSLSLLLGGFPSEYEVMELIQSKRLSSIPVSFYIYTVLIVLLAVLGAIYQQLKLSKEIHGSEYQTQRSSFISESARSHLQHNLDAVHAQIQHLINRYRISESFPSSQNNPVTEDLQLNIYTKMDEKQSKRPQNLINISKQQQH